MKRYPLILLIAFLVVAALLAIKPLYPADWAIENALAVAGVLVLVLTYRRFRLSKLSYTLIFIFLVLHEIGAHYTYAKVPYDDWFEALTGQTLTDLVGASRNHYDRLVHFAYGLLLAYPMREIFVRVAEVRGFWGYFLPLEMVMSTSMIYELLEWGAASVFGEGLGQAYLGTQGDVWDAQKDMLLATLGGLISLTIAAAVHRKYNRDFQREWAASLKVKDGRPLGEEAIDRTRRRPS